MPPVSWHAIVHGMRKNRNPKRLWPSRETIRELRTALDLARGGIGDNTACTGNESGCVQKPVA